MKSIPFKALSEARRLLELPERANLKLIKYNYRRLCRRWHPDKNPDNRDEAELMIKRINEAYRLIMVFVENYEYSFVKEEIQRWADPDGWWQDRFYQSDWIGGG